MENLILKNVKQVFSGKVKWFSCTHRDHGNDKDERSQIRHLLGKQLRLSKSQHLALLSLFPFLTNVLTWFLIARIKCFSIKESATWRLLSSHCYCSARGFFSSLFCVRWFLVSSKVLNSRAAVFKLPWNILHKPKYHTFQISS